MLRTVLTALVLASAAVACGGGSSGPKVVAGAPAGDVTEVTGTVTATRDGKTRPLGVGGEVAGDDVVETGADGHVAITLRHNLVPWTLGPGKKEQVSLSLAWKAPRATQTAAGPTGERSGAAGRHAEREAADTSANAATASTEAAMPEKAAAPPAPGAAPVAAAAPPPPPMDPPAPKMAADEPAPSEAPKPAPGGDDDKKSADDVGAGGLGLTGTGVGGGGTAEGLGLGNIGTLGHGSGTGEGQGYGAGGGGSLGARARKPTESKGIVRVFAARGGLETAIVARVVRQRNPRLLACVAPDAPARASMKLTIKADGKVDEVTVTGVSLTATQCLTKWMRATSFPASKATTSASIIVQGADPL